MTQTAPQRRKRRKRYPPLLPLLLGLGLFCGAFALGKASAVSDVPTSTEISPPAVCLPQAGSMEAASSDTMADAPEQTSSGEAEWNLIPVNGDHPLPEDFQTPELTQLRSGHAIDSRAYPALQRLVVFCRFLLHTQHLQH